VGMEDLFDYLKQMNFETNLKKLQKKLKSKTVIIYGTGLLFQFIQKNYDLSNLNIIGISDKKYTEKDEGQESLGYKIIPLNKIEEYKPDYVLLATQKFLPIMDDFLNNTFKSSKIKFLPLVDKPFFTLLKEIFE
jgi:hypothetical protein